MNRQHAIAPGRARLASPSCAAGRRGCADKKPDAKPVAVPFELLKSRHMAVEVKINGKGPYRLIFDTGAPTNLHQQQARQGGGRDEEGQAAPFCRCFGMGEVEVMDTLEVGGVKARERAGDGDGPPDRDRDLQALGPIDGIVGFPFFAQFKTTRRLPEEGDDVRPHGSKPPVRARR